MFGDLNKKLTVKEGINTSNMEYHKLKEFVGQTVNPVGFFISNGNFGRNVTLVTEECLINMPNYCTETFDNLTDEQINAIKDGKLLITDIEEKEMHGNMGVVFRYADK